MKFLIAIIMTMLLPGLAAASPTIDASTEDSFNNSIEELRETLSQEDRDRFDGSVGAYLMSSMLEGRSILEIGALSEEDLEIIVEEARAGLHGKTADDVIGSVSEQASANPADPKDDNNDNEVPEGFIIESTNFYFRDSGYSNSPVIELKVTNNTGHAVSQAFFRGLLVSPNRSVPWVDERFNYSIAGGIEPGETLEWRLSPNSFGPWGNTSIPDDAELNIEVIRLIGADGEPLSDL